MSSNNYFGFTHGGAQYGQAGSYQTAQSGYAVTPASYTTQRSAYETAYTPAATNSTPATAYASTYGGIVSAVSAGAPAAATYEYGYARPAATTYETPKQYYQQPVAAANYTTADYQQAAAKPSYTASAYAGTAPRPVPLTTQTKVAYAPNTVSYQTQTAQPVAATYSSAYVNTTQQQTTQTQPMMKQQQQQPPQQQQQADKKTLAAKYVVPTVTAAAVATQQPVAAQQQHHHQQQQAGYSPAFTSTPIQTGATPIQTTSAHSTLLLVSGSPQWPPYKKPFMSQPAVRKVRTAPKPQQIHYCEVCKISCGGIMTYREHLEGQKHKKKEAAAKTGTPAPAPGRHGSSLVCELCDVTCTGQDAYAAHIRGSKHQKVVKLHTKLGKPIPAAEPVVVKKEVKSPTASTTTASVADNDPTDMDTVEPDIEPVGQDYIEEIKTDDGKIVFNCKLCDCKFNDPNAKEMHMKGRRHRLQYKKKVDPALVVDVKVNNRTKKLQEDRLKRQHQREEFYRQREEWGGYPMPPMMHRPFDGPMGPMMGMGFFPQMRRPESADDRHVIARHSAIYPKKEELDAVHKIVSHNEKALKLVSDFLAEEAQKKVFEPEIDIHTAPSPKEDRFTLEKTSRARKSQPETWRRNKAALDRQHGRPYITSKNEEKPAKTAVVGATLCSDSCRYKCSSKFSDDDRQNILKDFYSHDVNGKNVIIFNSIRKINVKSPRLGSKHRAASYIYIISKGEQELRVCKAALCALYQIGVKKVDHIKNQVGEGVTAPPLDRRAAPKAGTKAAAATIAAPGKPEEKKEENKKVDGSDGSMFSFQQGKDDNTGRVLKGAMRVGALAKGLLLTGDTAVDLVVLCAEKPTRTLLLKVAEVLPKQLQIVAPDEKYMVQKKPEDAALTVMDTKEPHNTVTITLTSPLMREQTQMELSLAAAEEKGMAASPAKPVTKDPPDVLDKAKCLDALAALRHAKWFQARAQGLQSCVMVIRIIRDLCQRVPTWAPLNSWAMELLVEKVISSSNGMLSLGDSLRRVMEAVASGVLLPTGPGLMDPCEKDAVDAVGNVTNQQREDITASAQLALRLIAFRQIHKVLGMDPLPPPRFLKKFPRKRRLEPGAGDAADGADGKKVKDENSVTTK